MSELRQRAREVKQEGAIRRRNWSPTRDSAHYKVYRYWERKSGKRRTQENFCHYWRTVMIWGPLRWLGMVLGYVVPGVGLCGLTWVVWTNWTFSWQIALFILALAAGVAYFIAGLMAVAHVSSLAMPDRAADFKVKQLEGRGTLAALAVVLTLPVSLVVTCCLVVFGPIVVLFVRLHTVHDLYGKTGRWIVQAHPGDHAPLSWMRPWVAAPGTVVLLSPWHTWAFVMTLVMFGLSLLVGCVVLLAFLADKHKTRMEETKEARALAQLRKRNFLLLTARYSILRQRLEVTSNWLDWLEVYNKKYLKQHGHDPMDEKEAGLLLVGVRSEFDNSEWAVILAPDPLKGPSIIRRVTVGLMDYLVLVWSYVLINKWKTCPLVELPR